LIGVLQGYSRDSRQINQSQIRTLIGEDYISQKITGEFDGVINDTLLLSGD